MIIKGAIVCDYEREQKGDVKIQDGKIVDVQKSLLPEPCEEIIDAEGLLLLPALIDLNVRVAGDLLTSDNLSKLAKKALEGGVGTVALMPDCTPALDNEVSIELLNRSQSELGVQILPIASAINQESKGLSDLAILHKKGSPAIALESSLDGNLAKRVCEYALLNETAILCRAEDPSLRGEGVMNDSYLSAKMGLPGIPSLSEVKEVAKMVETAIFMRTPMLFQALSSERSFRLIRRAREEFGALYSEVSIHHLVLSEDVCEGFHTGAKILPPLKSEATRRRLLGLLKEGVIDTLTSLQSAQSISKKDVAFEEAAFGIDHIRDYFSLCYTFLHKQEHISLGHISRLASKRAAEILNLPSKGYIGIGADADLILVDPKSSKVIEDPLSPYYNSILHGLVERTMIGGESLYVRKKFPY